MPSSQCLKCGNCGTATPGSQPAQACGNDYDEDGHGTHVAGVQAAPAACDISCLLLTRRYLQGPSQDRATLLQTRVRSARSATTAWLERRPPAPMPAVRSCSSRCVAQFSARLASLMCLQDIQNKVTAAQCEAAGLPAKCTSTQPPVFASCVGSDAVMQVATGCIRLRI